MFEKTSLILLDEGANWDAESKVLAHWTQLNVPLPQESISQKTAKRAEEIRTEYFAWIHDLGQTHVGGRTLIASLKVLENLSYWWMTFIALKSPFESDSLYTVFKLRSLERLYYEHDCLGVVYCGNNQVLNETLEDWCRKQKHPYKRFETKIKTTSQVQEIRKWLRKLPYWIQALVYLIKNWYLR